MTPDEVLTELSDYADLLREVFDEAAGERYLDLLGQAESIVFKRGYWTGYANSPITDKDD